MKESQAIPFTKAWILLPNSNLKKYCSTLALQDCQSLSVGENDNQMVHFFVHVGVRLRDMTPLHKDFPPPAPHVN